jgi:hypothetical protein
MFAIEVQPWWKDPNWLTAIGTIAATVIAALAIAYSIFKESIWSWWNRPKLVLSTTPGRPDWAKTFFSDPGTGKRIADCYYFRIRVSNKGRRRAESVELFAKELKEKRAGRFHVIHTFPSMDLLWSNLRVPELSISPKVEKHCDVGFVLDPMRDGSNVRTQVNVGPGRCLFTFDLQVKPNDGAHIVGPGHYQLTIVAASANTSSLVRELELTITGDWFDNEAEMFSDRGVQIHLLD